MKGPRLMVRALIVDDGRLLVNERPGRLALFGGRVEKGETARYALERELEEELGVRVEVGRLAYQIENFFVDERQRRIHELGLYYAVRPLQRLGSHVVPKEKGLAPFWMPLADLAGSTLRPDVLRERLARDLAAASPSTVQLVSIDRVNFPEVL
jgi:ADP-ribose pyrophosphatase YjhB (NUDIX family)